MGCAGSDGVTLLHTHSMGRRYPCVPVILEEKAAVAGLCTHGFANSHRSEALVSSSCPCSHQTIHTPSRVLRSPTLMNLENRFQGPQLCCAAANALTLAARVHAAVFSRGFVSSASCPSAITNSPQSGPPSSQPHEPLVS